MTLLVPVQGEVEAGEMGRRREKERQLRETESKLTRAWPLIRLSSRFSACLPAVPSSSSQALPVCRMSSELRPSCSLLTCSSHTPFLSFHCKVCVDDSQVYSCSLSSFLSTSDPSYLHLEISQALHPPL